MPGRNGQLIFGAGRLFMVPNITAPTPTRPGLVQDMALSMRRDIKRIYGSKQLPADVASGALQIVGSSRMGALNSFLLKDIMLGVSGATGQHVWIVDEAGTVPSSPGPYTVTVANTPLSVDLGVIRTATNTRLTRVASGPVGNQYSLSGNVYTFGAGVADAAIKISYVYTQTTDGEVVTMTNQEMGKIGNFKAVMTMLHGTSKATIELYNCMGGNYDLATVLDDYMRPGFGFEAAVDDTDTLGTFSFAESN